MQSAATSAASRDADADPAQITDPVVPSTSAGWLTIGSRLPRGNRLMWSALVVVAATIVCCAVFPVLPGNQQPNDLVAELSPSQSAQDHALVAGGNQASRMLAGNTSEALTGPGHTEAEIIGGATEPLSPFEAARAAEAALGAESSGSVASNDVVVQPSSVAHVKEGGSSLRSPAFDYLMIIDAVVSADGWKNGRFEALLGELEIPIATSLVADEELFKALEETRVVVGSADADASGEQPRAALVFLRASGTTLERLHIAMNRDPANFPQVVTDLSIDALDPQSAVLHKLLRGQQQDGVAYSGPSARVLSVLVNARRDDDLVPNFVPAAPRVAPRAGGAPAEAVAGLKSLDQGDDNPLSEVLVILREPSSK
jgi:hypothetical protein